MLKNGMPPVHPGSVLREDYLKPLSMAPSALAQAIKVEASLVDEIVQERRGIDAEMALRLAHYFGGEEDVAQGWLNMQVSYDLKVAQRDAGPRIKDEVRPRAG